MIPKHTRQSFIHFFVGGAPIRTYTSAHLHSLNSRSSTVKIPLENPQKHTTTFHLNEQCAHRPLLLFKSASDRAPRISWSFALVLLHPPAMISPNQSMIHCPTIQQSCHTFQSQALPNHPCLLSTSGTNVNLTDVRRLTQSRLVW